MSSQTLLNVLLCLTITQLICDSCRQSADIQFGSLLLTQATASEQTQAPTKGAPEQQLQRFLEDPKDHLAVVGQPIDLSCVVENKRGILSWKRDGVAISYEGVPEGLAVNRFNVDQDQQQQQLTNGSVVIITKTNLHINSVSLKDDAPFFCQVASFEQQPAINSRKAHITVLQPPSRLSVDARYAGEEAGQPLSALADQQPNGPAASEQGEAADSSIVRIKVKQNARLRLECRTDLAKPYAELLWLDHERNKVLKRNFSDESGSEGGDDDSFVEELIRADQDQPKLASASLFWTLKVERYHSNKLLTCLGNHLSFNQSVELPQLFGRQLKRQALLEVLYEPSDIKIIKEPAEAIENRPIKFLCHAEANPNKLTYRWFIDRQPVVNASDSELRIERVTRQMHLREIECEVTNEIGSSRGLMRLVVKYSPAFVSHLLANSLNQQPPLEGEQHNQANSLALTSRQQHQAKAQSGKLSWPPSKEEVALARQLAIGFNRTARELRLQCDFDSNPRLQKVLWFKVNTDYRTIGNVSSLEADALIERGAAHAIFKEVPARPPQQALGFDRTRRRHIVTASSEHGANNEAAASFAPTTTGLDYEQMSIELLDELANYTEVMRQLELSKDLLDATNGSQSIVEDLPLQTMTQSSPQIFEPLAWVWNELNQTGEKNRRSFSILDQDGSVMNASTLSRLSLPEPEAYQEPQDSLVLLRGTNATMNLARRNAVQFWERQAPISSSFITLRNPNEDSIGKYVCEARMLDGRTKSARSVYLIMHQMPRIISSKFQGEPLGSTEMQIDCLTQINAFIENATIISWFKNGKPLDLMQRDQTGERKYEVHETRSRDFLFMLSRLRINRAVFSDFGQYNCTATNSLGTDYLLIELQPTAPTGFLFGMMVSMLIGSLLVLVCVVSLVIIFSPRRKLDAKLTSHAGVANAAANLNCALDRASDRKSPASESSTVGEDSQRCNESISCETGSQKQNCDNNNNICGNDNDQLMVSNAQHIGPNSQAATVLNSMMIRDQLINHHQQRAASCSGDQLSDSSSNGNLHPHHRLRSSLRQPIVSKSSSMQATSRSNAKFAAIHESLEHKLNLGKSLFGPQAQHYEGETEAVATMTPKSQGNDNQASSGSTAAIKSQAVVSELEPNSLASRLWARLMMRPERAGLGNNSSGRRVKSRPIISMPVNMTTSGSALKRSSLSTSLSVLGTESGSNIDSASAAPASITTTIDRGVGLSDKQAGNSYNPNHISGGHLVSSSANLIQDGATTSDGMASSGRSSSNSSGGHHHHHLNRHHHHLVSLSHHNHNHNQIQDPIPLPQLNYASSNYIQQTMWLQQQHQQQRQQLQQPVSDLSPKQYISEGHHLQNGGSLECSLYVNGSGYQQDNNINNSIYNNHLAHYQTNGLLDDAGNGHSTSAHMTNGFAHSPPTNVGSQAGHYQMPSLLVGDQQSATVGTTSGYFTTNQTALQNGRACYATICNKPQIAAQQLVTNQNSASNGHYGTLSLRPSSAQMVTVADVGDPYYGSVGCSPRIV